MTTKQISKKKKSSFSISIPSISFNNKLFKVPCGISSKKHEKPLIPIPTIIPTPIKKIKQSKSSITPNKNTIHTISRQRVQKKRLQRYNMIFKGKDYDIKPPHNIKKIATLLNNNGGRCYIVGGYVRDILLNKRPKDIDLEVHGLTLEEISLILNKYGYRVDEVGKSFGVLKVKDPDTKEIIDIAVPERIALEENQMSHSLVSPTPYDAAKRRDLTINAIMYDTKDDKVVDPFNGVKDLENGNIRHVSQESFKDDPLRAVRAAEFASRFGFTIDPETIQLAKKIDTSQMAPERVTEEMRKVFEKSKTPSIFFNELDQMGQLEKLFPEVKQLQNVKQDPIHHPEGNAYIHTMQVIDRISESDKRKLEMLVTALFHDLGKITKSTEDPDTKRIHAKGHEEDSERMATIILNKYKFTTNEIKNILTIIKYHMRPHMLVNENTMSLKHKHRLLREICTTKNMMKDPSGSINRYCDIVDFAKHDHPKNQEKYEELKNLPPIEHYKPEVTGQDLFEQGFRGKELAHQLEDIYLSKINHLKKKKI